MKLYLFVNYILCLIHMTTSVSRILNLLDMYTNTNSCIDNQIAITSSINQHKISYNDCQWFQLYNFQDYSWVDILFTCIITRRGLGLVLIIKP